MRIIFLGTNGWYSSPTGDTACILLDTKDQYIILDSGNGIYKLDNFIKEDKPIKLFISHFHIDHTSGLHTLVKFNFKQGIDIYAADGRRMDFETLVNPPYTIGHKNKPENIGIQKTEYRLHEFSELQEDNLEVSAIKLKHAYEDHGYRFEIDGKIISYTGDTGITENVFKLAENADVLISECTNKNTADDDKWGHLDPVQAATMARKANTKKLILTHFGANLYTSFEDRKWAEEEAKKIFENTTSASDLMEFEV